MGPSTTTCVGVGPEVTCDVGDGVMVSVWVVSSPPQPDNNNAATIIQRITTTQNDGIPEQESLLIELDNEIPDLRHIRVTDTPKF